MNFDTTYIQIPIVGCWKFAIVGTDQNGADWKYGITSFVRQPFNEKNHHHHHHLLETIK